MESATDVEAYLNGLPEDRRDQLSAVRRVILENLPDGYDETVRWGMICYEVPMDRSGPTYNGQPLMYAALASQKRHMSLYLTSVYADAGALEEFRSRYLAKGARLDMGKSCVRFTSLAELPLDVIGDTVAAVGVDQFLAMSDAGRQR